MRQSLWHLLLKVALFYLIAFLFASVHLEAKSQALPQKARLKDKALLVLKARCNTCHRRHNPLRIFNRKNMDKNATRIYEQIFVRARMPKGQKLNKQEITILKDWLGTQNIIAHGDIN